jgi:hypothetical protein
MKSIYSNNTNTLSGLTDTQIINPQNNEVLKYENGAWKNKTNSSGLSSIGLSMPSEFTVTNSPLISDGTINVSFNSQNQNTFLAAPSSLNGIPSFRTISNLDIQNLDNSYVKSIRTNDLSLTAEKNSICYMPNGGTLTIPDTFSEGDKLIISAGGNTISTVFAVGTNVFSNFQQAGSVINPAFLLKFTTIEISLWRVLTQKSWHINRVSQNRSDSICTLNGLKISSIGTINNIQDINISSPITNQFLKYNAGLWENDDIELLNISDINISSPQNNQLLTYNNNNSKWENTNNYNYKTTLFIENQSIIAQYDTIYSSSNSTFTFQNPTLSDIGKRILITSANGTNSTLIFPSGVFLYNETNFLSISSFGSIELIVSSATQYQILSVHGDWSNITAGGKRFQKRVLNDLNDLSITTPSNKDIIRYNSTTQTWENKSLSLCNPTAEIYQNGAYNFILVNQNQWYRISIPSLILTNNSNVWTTNNTGELNYIYPEANKYGHGVISFSANASANNALLEFAVYKNGVIIPNSNYLQSFRTSSDFQIFSVHKVLQFSQNDSFDLYVQSPTNSNVQLTFAQFNFVIMNCCPVGTLDF